eukprot:CAMPEP_0185520342 /NCGR_PEP_ID=MMETSP1366-20130426/77123_1 /TAXON_ID=38817 /ORGANISM="Gephyrocapsa oceanica, Strain RCC1303" /LENGTH=214 /DNA_ID=CAMNT_0028131439 /DNA_START=27 /DNA_END=671 /DNA_ORIENTATION=-
MPPKRKGPADAAASDSSTQPWRDVEGYFADMSRTDLLTLLGKAWDSSTDVRELLGGGLADRWAVAGEQTEMLKVDWELSNEAPGYVRPKVIEFKGRAKKSKEKIALLHDWSFTMQEMHAVIENGHEDGFQVEDDEYPYENGCEECGAPGSNISLVLETNRAGKKRVRARAEVYCSCMTRYGEPQCADWTEAIFYPKGENVGAKTSERAKAARKK